MKDIWILLVACGLAFGFTACSSDDDDESGSGVSGEDSTPTLTDTNGDRYIITEITGTYYEYDTDWNLTAWEDDDNYHVVSYNPLYMEGGYEEDDYSYTETFSNFSLNSDGYITQMTFSYSADGGDDYKQSGSGTYSISYDGSGHITKIIGSGTETYNEYGDTWDLRGSSNAIFTWNDGLLTEATIEYSGTEDGESYSEEEYFAFDYGDKEYENKTKQNTPITIGYVYHDIFGALSYIGYFGIGPTYHPTSVYYDSEGWIDTEEFSYTLNDNGTVDVIKELDSWGDDWEFVYADGTRAASERSSKVTHPASTNRKAYNRHSLLRSRRSTK